MDKIASIIITTYNRADLLEKRSLRSALKQVAGVEYYQIKPDDYEIIVVGDHCTDNTHEVMQRYPSVKFYNFTENKGLSCARNFGIKQAVGKYVVCLDDDNELMPKFLSKTLSEIGDADALGVGRIVQYKEYADYASPIRMGQKKLSPFTSIDWGWLIKRECFDTIQYDEDLRANEDADFGIRFLKQFKAKMLNQPLTIAYDEFGDPKKSLSFPNARELDGMQKFYNKNRKEYEGHPEEMWHLYKLMGRKFYRGGHRLRGIRYFGQGLIRYPKFRSFLHFFFILFGWTVYDFYMSLEERVAHKLR